MSYLDRKIKLLTIYHNISSHIPEKGKDSNLPVHRTDWCRGEDLDSYLRDAWIESLLGYWLS
jgi:hypothetical protein